MEGGKMRLAVAMGDGGDVECCCQATATARRQLLRLPAAHSVFDRRENGDALSSPLSRPLRTFLRDGDFQEAEKGHRYGPPSQLCECILPTSSSLISLSTLSPTS
ncbi:hypothetical protein MTO96_007307 [Rhipicephalus appendiculatus]